MRRPITGHALKQSKQTSMKLLTQLSLVAVLTVLGTGIATAGDQQLENRRALERIRIERSTQGTTVAVYVDRRAVSQRDNTATSQAATRFELRSTSQGQVSGEWVPVK
jgi:hypothetical protein